MERTLIFNHIPRTGGTTLRVILNKVYGEDRVFFINSRDIPSSLKKYKSMDVDEQRKYRVISGHGANEYVSLVERPFRITILREPVSLFISQYYYLRKSHNSNFLEAVSRLDSLNQYIEYALEHGQDNMMTRLLDPGNKQLYKPENPPPKMELIGDNMLNNSLDQLIEYDAVIGLNDFDGGIYALAKLLAWKRIPFYRPLNKSVWNYKMFEDDPALREKVMNLLRFDIKLYHHFLQNNNGTSRQAGKSSLRYSLFSSRQRIIKMISKIR